MQIGIISDTHNILPKSVFKHFQNVDHIFHAGDIGSLNILEDLKQVAPVSAIYGNIDHSSIRKVVPSILFENFENRFICLVHDIGSVKNFSYELFKTQKNADIIINGHTHRPSYEIYQKRIYINPGSVSYPRILSKGTIAIAEFDKNNFTHQFIEIEV